MEKKNLESERIISQGKIDFAGLDRRGVVGTLKEGEFEYSLKTSQVFLLGMAARLLCSGERGIVLYARNLQTFCLSKRQFSSQGQKDPKETTDVQEVAGEPLHTWLDIRAGIFGPSDHRLPLPGNVGLSQQLEPTVRPPIQFRRKVTPGVLPDVLTSRTNHENQAIDQYIKNTEELDKNIVEETIKDMPQPADILECRAQQCPELIKKDFLDLFPGHNLQDGPLAVITLSQKTQCDMSAWSEDMEIERDELIEYFIMAAEEICGIFKSEGYWADFIDPSCGRPYHGQFTNATLFETDERYRHMGFRIEDLGCCKVISHRLWGSHVFVGSIFTNAPVDSDVMELALRKHQSPQCPSS
nr:methylmalonic aciduria and homocystinuria type D homolog, mitochondrial-like isoform X2 [Penaeus vannamei]